MAENTPSQAFLHQRKMLVVAPIGVVPVLTIMFALFGGGPGVKAADPATAATTGGANFAFPAASKSTIIDSKLAAYNAPKKEEDNSLGAGLSFNPAAAPADAAGATAPGGAGAAGAAGTGAVGTASDPNVVAIQQRMQLLQKQQSAASNAPAQSAATSAMASTAGRDGTDVQYERSMKELDDLKREYERRLNGGPTGEASAARAPAAPKAPTTRISEANTSVVSRLGGGSEAKIRPGGKRRGERSAEVAAAVPAASSGFHTVGEDALSNAPANALPAVIHSAQTVVDGSTVKMRLTEDAHINGKLIPRNSFLYGICHLAGERLTIDVKSVQLDNDIVPMGLRAYDIDGNEGLYIPGAITRDAAKQGASDGLSAADALTMSPSLAGQAAGAVLQGTKGLVGRKARLVKVNLKPNYKILLKPSA